MAVKFFNSPSASEEDLKGIGGGSIHRPLSYDEFDTNFRDIYPVGSIYMNATDGTDPNTLLGFGIWERVPVGKSLLGLNYPTTGAAQDLRYKIKSASIENGDVTIELQPVLSDDLKRIGAEDPNNIAYTQGKLNARDMTIADGIRVKVVGISNYTGTNPNGVHEANLTGDNENRVPSEMNLDVANDNNNFLKYKIATTEEQIALTDGQGAPYSYSIRGASDESEQDDAYVLFFDKESYPAGNHDLTTFNNANNSPANNRTTINSLQVPAHSHKPKQTVTTSFSAIGNFGRRESFQTKVWTKFLGVNVGKKYATAYRRNTRDYGSDKIPNGRAPEGSAGYTGWSNIDNPANSSPVSYGTNYEVQGAEVNKSDHNNMQPYVAVHMWKRIA